MTVRTQQQGIDRRVRVGDLDLAYRESGDPGGAAVLVLHGIMGHAREWDVLVDALSPRFRVIGLDQRGHGRSDWAEEYTAKAMAADIVDVVGALDLAPVCIVAHSMGAMAAQIATALRPDLVDRLVIIDIAPASVEEAGPMLAEWMEGLVARRYRDADEALDEWMTGNHLAREPLMRHYVEHNLVADGSGLRWRFDPRIREFVLGGVTAAELWEAIDRITVPTLLIRGEHSPHLSEEAARAVLDRLPDGRFARIRSGAHDLGVEQPEQVAAAVQAFLEGGGPGPVS
ncbi:MAG: alpha/beta fold hydrolase [Actinomycetota bacterium]